ncbi:PadR family transcriptional regulator [Roseivirga seohaensis]|uniref:PadR family transcriptional regulator n=1 Tax=Roseivirga seohaensis TaxID=1914963 RepID=UPI003BAAE69E
MKGTFLGEFEEVVLLATCVLNENAYANLVKDEVEKHTERNINLSGIHSSLYRLEKKGFLSSELGEASQKRGGKRKRIFKPTPYGLQAVQQIKEIRESLWNNMPQTLFQNS